MTKSQRIQHKKGNQRRREHILQQSKGVSSKLAAGNLCIHLGGVCQKGKYSNPNS